MKDQLVRMMINDANLYPHMVTIILSYDGITYDEESDHSNKAVRKTPEIESGHKVSEEVK